jgi:hypothetical protein
MQKKTLDSIWIQISYKMYTCAATWVALAKKIGVKNLG